MRVIWRVAGSVVFLALATLAGLLIEKSPPFRVLP